MREKTYATGKEIPTTTNVQEIFELFKSGNDESNANRLETQFIFSWNYNRLTDNKKDEVCKLIKEYLK